MDEIRFLIKKIDVDILCISETWLSDKINNAEIYIDGYGIVGHDRQGGCRGGGVCMYIRNTLPFDEKVDMTTDTPIEAIWIELKMKKSQ